LNSDCGVREPGEFMQTGNALGSSKIGRGEASLEIDSDF
jgi:hypothetical protein